MAKDKEIEIQVRVQNIKPLLAFLKKKAKLVGTSRQIDQYYTAPHRDFTSVRPINEWLRLRDSSGKLSINYKNWHYEEDNSRSFYCDEYETTVENLDSLKKLFNVLDFKPLIQVDKSRQTWIYENYEIAIDKVAGLGDFVEVEYKGKAQRFSPKIIANKMIEFLKGLRLGKITLHHQGYAQILLLPDEAKYEEV